MTCWNWDASFPIWQVFAHINRQITSSSNRFSNKGLCEKIREDMTGGPINIFSRKAVVCQAYIRKLSNVWGTKLELMLANQIRFQYVRMCRPEFTQDGSLTLKVNDSWLEITEQEISKTWLCFSIKNWD